MQTLLVEVATLKAHWLRGLHGGQGVAVSRGGSRPGSHSACGVWEQEGVARKVGSSSSDAGGSDGNRSRPSVEPDYWADEAGGERACLRSSVVLHSVLC